MAAERLMNLWIWPWGLAAWAAAAAMFLIASACDSAARPEPAPPEIAESGLPIERVVLPSDDGPEPFRLEVAADDSSREFGLRMREEIAADGGMIFVFPDAEVRSFVMPDCFVPIDIIFLGPDGRVTQTHTMAVEPPRGEGEGEVGDLEQTPENLRYLRRLPRYGSRFAAQYAIELRAGTIDALGIEPGDVIELDFDRLKSYLQ